ncbi:MAG TPA: hypothetical protein VNW99_11545 [Cytophagaceae bacterium]|jgi:hypothetical protein|nr:hypothetical protein [Cytophagaceae bacterium]
MQILIAIACVILLFILLYQDFKERHFSAIILPCLFFLFVFFNISSIGLGEYLNNIKINLVSTVLVFTLLSVLISLKNRKLVNITKSHFALGDLLFYLTCCFLFSFLNYFIFFFMLTPLLTIISITIIRIMKKDLSHQIPLAGIQSGILMLFFVSQIFFDFIKLNKDYQIMNLING